MMMPLSSIIILVVLLKVIAHDLLDHLIIELLAEMLSKVVVAGLLGLAGSKPITVVPIDDFVSLFFGRPFHSVLDYAFGL